MKKIVFASFIIAALTGGPAVAADMAVKALFNSQRVADWKGIYGGVHLGADWGYFLPESTLPGPSDVGGNVTFGGQVGYNWQSGRFVYGVEADVSWIDIHARSVGARFDEDWMATFRVRL